MSEQIGAERFEHAVIHTDPADVYVLDIYESPELVFEGLYMPPIGVSVAKRLTGTTLRLETECPFECAEPDSSG